jgi:hypothetical protein
MVFLRHRTPNGDYVWKQGLESGLVSRTSGRWAGLPLNTGTLRELKESTAKIKIIVRRESRIFSKFSLIGAEKKFLDRMRDNEKCSPG